MAKFRNYMKKVKEKLYEDTRWIYVIILGFIFLFVLIILPSSLAVVQPVASVEIFSENLSYQNKEPGAWKVTQSARWINKGEAEITIDVDSIVENNKKKTDILFVIDNSNQMNDNIEDIKYSLDSTIDSLFNADNRVGLITFNETFNVLSDFTNKKEELANKINSISTSGARSYYQALKGVENVLNTYQKVSDRECVVVLLIGGYSSVDKANQESEYNILKENYPFININAIQYKMGNSLLNPIKEISDNQYLVVSDIFEKSLLEATSTSKEYDEFTIINYLNSDYFYLENTDSNSKIYEFIDDENKLIWNLNNYNSGQSEQLKVKVKLKSDLVNVVGIYLLFNGIEILSKISDSEEYVNSNSSLILSNNYNVIYDVNAPNDCVADVVLDNENYFVLDTVSISSVIPKCSGYQFKGWRITNSDVSVVNDDYFIMPEEDVEIKGTWSKLDIKKSMNGTIKENLTLYKQVQKDVDDSTKYAKKYAGYTYNFSGNEDVYYYYGAAKNNNVIFADYCWKIVRTTSTGGVKLLYNGVPSGGKCNNTGNNSQLTASQMGLSTNVVAFNELYKSPADVGYMYNSSTRYKYKSISASSTSYLMGNSFVYSGGAYTLYNTKSSAISSSTLSSLTNYHYTCFNTTGKCTTLYYFYSLVSDSVYYIELTGGKSVENALDEMFNGYNVNSTSSTIKQAIDYWYKNNMTSYTKYLEDTVWCNDRSIYALGSWNPNGGNYLAVEGSYLLFKSYNDSTNLTCENRNDRFTTSYANGNGDLDYPVGLITRQEQNLAYSSSKSPLSSGNYYWGLSPRNFNPLTAKVFLVSSSGDISDSSNVYNESGVRPAISLKADTIYSSGDGSTVSPYIIDLDS